MSRFTPVAKSPPSLRLDFEWIFSSSDDDGFGWLPHKADYVFFSPRLFESMLHSPRVLLLEGHVVTRPAD